MYFILFYFILFYFILFYFFYALFSIYTPCVRYGSMRRKPFFIFFRKILSDWLLAVIFFLTQQWKRLAIGQFSTWLTFFLYPKYYPHVLVNARSFYPKYISHKPIGWFFVWNRLRLRRFFPGGIFLSVFHHVSINKYRKQIIKAIIIVLWALTLPYNIYIFLLLM
jgi:hypothetical protein